MGKARSETSAERRTGRKQKGGRLQLDICGLRKEQVVLRLRGVYANLMRGVLRAIDNGIGMTLLVNGR